MTLLCMYCRDNVDWETWSCDLDKRQGEISDLMVNNASVREHYKSMVPDQGHYSVLL